MTNSQTPVQTNCGKVKAKSDIEVVLAEFTNPLQSNGQD